MAKKLFLLFVLILLAGCGGGGTGPAGGDPPANPVPGPGSGADDVAVDPATIVVGEGFSLGVLKNASGVPQGVRVSWTRVNVAGVQGYYIYRDSVTIPPGNPAGHSGKRVNGGNIIPQSGTGTQTLTFDDIFTPAVGSQWFYRMTVVNSTSDESDFSNEQSITIAQHTITNITTTAVGIGDQVTITGTHFGATRSGDQVFFTNSSGSTSIEAASYVSWSDTEIVVTVPYRAADGVIGVKVGSVTVLSSQSIAYREPTITNLNPTEDYVGNLFITITGTDFGPAPDPDGTSTSVTFGGTPAQNADIDDSQWTTTTIKVKVPAAAVGGTVAVQVDVAGNLSNTQNFLILPHINNLSSTQGTTGSSITINGTNFGATQSTGTVTVSGVSAAVTSWNNTAIVITIPAAAVDGNVVVTRSDSKVTNGVGYDVVPTISGFAENRRTEGQNLTINGSGFGNSRGTSTVTFNGGSGIVASNYPTWTDSQIVVTVPTGAVTGTVNVDLVDTVISGSDDDSATSGGNVTIVLPAPTITGVGQL